MAWDKLLLENTNAPFGIEQSGGVVYLKVTLDDMNKNHQFIKDRVEYIEQIECKKIENLPIISNIRRLKDGHDLLRLRVKVFKNRKTVKMSYGPDCPKEDYLKTIDEIPLDAKISVKISIGAAYKFFADGTEKLGLNLYVDEVTIL